MSYSDKVDYINLCGEVYKILIYPSCASKFNYETLILSAIMRFSSFLEFEDIYLISN